MEMQLEESLAKAELFSKTKSNRVLQMSLKFWFGLAFIGMILFIGYIILFYGGALLNNNIEAWAEVSITGYESGDLVGNIVFGAHVFVAVLLTLGGLLQLIPKIRKKSIAFHRWNGRLFLVAAYIVSIGGLYLVWIRESTLNPLSSIAVSGNGILILVFGFMAWKYARSHNYSKHRKWALRTFMVVSGVWFFRVGMMAWFIINQGPVGSTESLDGPFDQVFAFANYLFPLGILELYFYVSKTNRAIHKYLFSGLLFALTIVMGIGIFGAFMFMWLPNM